MCAPRERERAEEVQLGRLCAGSQDNPEDRGIFMAFPRSLAYVAYIVAGRAREEKRKERTSMQETGFRTISFFFFSSFFFVLLGGSQTENVVFMGYVQF